MVYAAVCHGRDPTPHPLVGEQRSASVAGCIKRATGVA
jgi:hypothetical protein